MKNNGQRDREETKVNNGLRMKFDTLTVETGADQRLVVEEILILGLPAGAIKKAEAEDLLRMILVEVSRGKLLETADVRMGINTGKEYRIETATGQIRARAYVVQNRLMMIRAEGSKAYVESEPAGIFLDSCRLTVGNLNNPPKVGPGPPVVVGPPRPPVVGPGPAVGPVADKGRQSKIVGIFNDPEFVDEGPAGGMMVGVDLAMGNDVFKRPVVQALR